MTPLRRRFDALTELLRAHRSVWGPRPFDGLPLSWEAEFPAISQWIEGLPAAVFDDFEGGWVTPDAPATLQGWATSAAGLARHPILEVTRPVSLSVDARRRVPGRKIEQIERFAGAVLSAPVAEPRSVIDWCAGKGHLGRAICLQNDARLLVIEWDPALCAEGETRCRMESVAAEFVCLDARSAEAATHISADATVVALHACGDLHAALLRAGAERRPQLIAVAPCCYNRAGAERGHALSNAGLGADLQLTTSDLDLIHREQVVARSRDRRRAWQSMAWRLGFDCLQRERLGGESYRTMPPFPKAWLRQPFADFCIQFAASDGLALPVEIDARQYEAKGWALLDQVRRRDAVRGLFRGALEAWLVLDRALFLEERSFAVTVGTFCERATTPRNALIIAQPI